MNRKWCLCVLSVVLLACSQHKPVQPVYNPMEAAWSGIRENINKLESEHVFEDEWRKAAELHPEPKAVQSITELKKQTEGMEFTSLERDQLTKDFNISSRVIHFGFECNYHALVFFDDAKRAWKVIKW